MRIRRWLGQHILGLKIAKEDNQYKNWAWKDKPQTHLWLWRLEKRLTTTAVAKAIDTKVHNLSKWERAAAIPTPPAIAKLATFYGRSLGYAFECMYADHQRVQGGICDDVELGPKINRYLTETTVRLEESK